MVFGAFLLHTPQRQPLSEAQAQTSSHWFRERCRMMRSQKHTSLAAKQQASTAGKEDLCMPTACMQQEVLHQAGRQPLSDVRGAEVEGDDDMHWALSSAVSDLH